MSIIYGMDFSEVEARVISTARRSGKSWAWHFLNPESTRSGRWMLYLRDNVGINHLPRQGRQLVLARLVTAYPDEYAVFTAIERMRREDSG